MRTTNRMLPEQAAILPVLLLLLAADGRAQIGLGTGGSAGPYGIINGAVTDGNGHNLVGATVTLAGSANATQQTDSAGAFTFPNLPAGGSYTITPAKSGYVITPPSLIVPYLVGGLWFEFRYCTSILALIQNIPYNGGTRYPTLFTPSGCAWTAQSNTSWVNASPGSGMGYVALNVSIPTANTAFPVPRTGSVSIAGQTTRFTQAPSYLDTSLQFQDVNYFDPMYNIQGDYGFGNYIGLTKYYLVTNGCSAGRFCPGDGLTREQTAAFLIRAMLYQAGDCDSSDPGCAVTCKHGYPYDAANTCGFQYPSSPYYSDVNSSNIFFPYIQKLKERNLAVDCGAYTYCPQNLATRAVISQMLIRGKYGAGFSYALTPYFNDVPVSASYFTYVQKMREQGISGGTTDTTFDPGGTLLRFQMAVFLIRGFFTAP
ncbi:MAG: carboxypeptidase regulatory-like domain-containing protein [Bryobacterales bacterium]|nr:carboxypeptidase regulatory-like domain-containing protein [Bryobacterales bacterium]